MKKLLYASVFALTASSASAGAFIDSFGRAEAYPPPQYGLSGYTVYLGSGVYANYQPLPPPPPVYQPPAYHCINLDLC